MKFDLKDFRKVQSTRSHTVMQHPHGHMIHLDHSKMDKKHMDDLKKLPFHDMKRMKDGGLIEEGNIDLGNRPRVKNPDGSVSTVRSMSFNDNGNEVLVPTVHDKGYIMSEDEAIKEYRRTGKHLGKFKSPEEATRYAQKLHEDQAAMLDNVKPVAPFPVDNANTPSAGIFGASQGRPLIQGENPPLAGIDKPGQNLASEQEGLVPKQAPGGQPQEDVLGTGKQLETLQQGLAGQEQGIKGQAEAESKLGREQAKIQGEMQKPLEALQADTQQKTNKILEENSMLEQGLREGKINPNHYMQDKGVLSNLLTGIGLVLGGAGAASTGGRNLAADFLDKQIDNDIKAQVNNIDNKQSLLNYNLKKMGNIQDASQLTRANLMTLTAAKLEQAASKAKDPMAQARAMQEIGRLKQGAAEIIAQTTARNNILSHSESGKITPEDAITAMNAPDSLKEKAREDLSNLRGAEAAVQNVNNMFKDAAKLSSAESALGANLPVIGQVGTESYKKLQTDRSQIINAIRSSMKGQGALSDQEIAQSILPQLPSAGDTKKDLANKQRALVDYLKSKVASTGTHLNTLHVKYKPNFKAEPID